MIAELLSLLGVLTLGLLSPGPDFLVVVKNSLGGTRTTALATVAGIALGLAVQCTVIVLGFAAAPPNVLRTVQWVGAAFLAYVGLRALFAKTEADGKEKDRAESERETDAASASSWVGAGAVGMPGGPSGPALLRNEGRRGFVEGLLCNLTNPKAFLFFVSLYAQFARGEGGGSPAFWRVAFPIASVAHALVAWSLVALTVQSEPVSRRLRRAQRWLPRAFGVALIGLAIWTAWSAR